jgi:hypothetical protein
VSLIRHWIVPDMQVPFHDVRLLKTLAQCIADNKGPNDTVTTIGDEMDFDMLGRWVKGSDKEWSRRIGKDRDDTVQILKDLQVDNLIRSNHTDRIMKTLADRAPGFIGLPELELENFLRLDEVGATLHKKAFQIAPGWLALHGDESGLSQLGGRTAANLAIKTGSNVVCGHTHRAGLSATTYGIYGRVNAERWGLEVGNAMDMTSSGAAYAKVHNWQQAFGILYQDGKKVTPHLVPVVNRQFIFEGVQYVVR